MRVCKDCGKEVSKSAKSCPNCGRKLKRTKKIILILISALLFLIIYGNVKGQKEDLRKFYVANTNLLVSEILLSQMDLYEVAKVIKENWYDFIYNNAYSSVDEAIEKAQEMKNDEILSIKNKNKEIENNYIELIQANTSSDKMAEIKDSTKELYEAYEDYYNFIIYPSGNYNYFSSKYNDLFDKLSSKISNSQLIIKINSNF